MSVRRPGTRAVAAGTAVPWVVGGASLVVLAQLRGLVRGGEGELVWNGSFVLVLLALGLANLAVWRLTWVARRLLRRRGAPWEGEA